MKIFRQLILAFSAFLLMRCEEVINVDLNTISPTLVVDASIDWEKGTTGDTQTIKLTTTSDYYADEVPAVSGAIVKITNNNDKDFTFAEVPGTGQYTCTNFEPVAGETYTLTINYDGQSYTSLETLVTVPALKDNIEQINDVGFAGDEIEFKYFFQDNGSEENFYMSSVQAPFIKFPMYTVESDKMSQGNEMFLTFSHEDIAVGDLMTIRLYGISERYFGYMTRLLEATGRGPLGDGPFTTTPAAVKGNIINQTNKANYALGYFRLSEVVTRNYVIQ
jgi:hypothetical protein